MTPKKDPLKIGDIYRVQPPGAPLGHDYVVLSEPSLIDYKCILVNFTCATKAPPKVKGLKIWDENDDISVNGDFKLTKPSILKIDSMVFQCHDWMARNNGIGPKGTCKPEILAELQAECFKNLGLAPPVVKRHINGYFSHWKK